MNDRFVIFRLPFHGQNEFKPLQKLPGVGVAWVRPQDYEGGAQVIALPGSGKTVADLDYLRQSGGEAKLRRHLALGGVVIGICGGYQILGETILDPFLKQGDRRETEGLGLLPITTLFGGPMLNCMTTAQLLVGEGASHNVTGEEHRSGYSKRARRSARHASLHKVACREFLKPRPAQREPVPGMKWRPGLERYDGLVSADRRVWGTYFHLIFHNDAFLRTFFASLP